VSDLKFNMNLQWFKFDVLGYERNLQTFMAAYIKESGRIWLDAATEHIPTWSGASRASFRKLARALGTSIQMGPQRSRKNREALGEDTSIGEIILDPQRDFYGFQWGSNLRYLKYNEFNHATPGPAPQPTWAEIKGTPYHFQKKALDAWRTHVQTVDLPDPLKAKFLKRFRIT